MSNCISPIVDVRTFDVNNSSQTYEVFTSQYYTSAMMIGSTDMWLFGGTSMAITVAARQAGALYLPRNTPLVVSTRMMQVQGTSHFAALRAGAPNGFLNVAYLNDILDDHDVLVSIHDTLLEQLSRKYGAPTRPHYDVPYEAHITY